MRVKWRGEKMPGGDAGTDGTLRILDGWARRRAIHPKIRETAIRALRGVPRGFGEIERLYEFVQSMDYRRDPVGAEFLQDPLVTLEVGAGDCDDRSALLAALLRSVGYRPEWEVGAACEKCPWGHVYLSVDTPAGPVVVDPTKGLSLGAVHPYQGHSARWRPGGFMHRVVVVPASHVGDSLEWSLFGALKSMASGVTGGTKSLLTHLIPGYDKAHDAVRDELIEVVPYGKEIKTSYNALLTKPKASTPTAPTIAPEQFAPQSAATGAPGRTFGVDNRIIFGGVAAALALGIVATRRSRADHHGV